MWNGVGGKIEACETPRESILREIEEETGIILESIEFKGLVTWSIDRIRVGGMYTYLAELPENYCYKTPIKTDEGILDWKDINWILDPENRGVASNIPRSIEMIINKPECNEYRCIYENDQLIKFETREINESIEYISDNKILEKEIFSMYYEEGHGIK